MAEVVVRYFGILREIARRSVEKVSIDDSSTAFDLIAEISRRHGDKFKNFVFDSKGKPRKSIAFAVNGDSVAYYRLQSTKCNKISEFVILPPISGG